QGDQDGRHDKRREAEDLHLRGVARGLHGKTPGAVSRSGAECPSVLKMALSCGAAVSPKMSEAAACASPYCVLMIAGTVPKRTTSTAVTMRGIRRASRASPDVVAVPVSMLSASSARFGACSK